MLSFPIGSGDYSMPSNYEVDETILMEDEIESIKDLLDLSDDKEEILKIFLEINNYGRH